MYFLKNLLLYSQALIRQTKYVVMMTKEGSTKIVNFMTPGTGVLVQGRCHIVNMFILPPAKFVGVYNDPYVRPSVRSFVRPSVPISNPLLL